jgi:hypothetical protein
MCTRALQVLCERPLAGIIHGSQVLLYFDFDSRAAANELASENDNLRDTMKQIEKDTIDVVAFLKGQDSSKDNEVLQLIFFIKYVQDLFGSDCGFNW